MNNTVFDRSKSAERQRVPAQTTLFLQGQTSLSFFVLHSGMAEIMSAESTSGSNASAILEKSIRVGLVKGETICGILGIYSEKPFAYSIRTLSECIVSNRPVERQRIIPSLQSNPKLNFQVLQALIQRVESAIFLFKNYKYLWHKFASIQDSIALAADSSPQRKTSPDSDRYRASLESYKAHIQNLLSARGVSKPRAWDEAVFNDQIQLKLDLYSQYDKTRIEDLFDEPQYTFIKGLMQKQMKLVAAMFYQDTPSNLYVFQFFGNVLERIVAFNRNIVLDINRIIQVLFSDKGWTDDLLKAKPRNSSAYSLFMKQLWKYSSASQSDTLKLLSIHLSKEYTNFTEMSQFRSAGSEHGATEGESDSQTAISPEARSRLKKYEGLLDKILQFSQKSAEFVSEMKGCVSQLKSLADIHSLDKQAVEIRSRLSTLYWELYETCFLRVIDSDLKSFIPGIMLHFGLIDETMISEKELALIDRAYSDALAIEEPISVMTLPYFLEKIYTGAVNPSISELGESFRDILKNQAKITTRRSTGKLYTDCAEDKVKYEIRNIAQTLTTLIYGVKEKAVPILHSQSIIGNLDLLLLGTEKTSEIIQEFRSRDYSLFYRETVAKHQFGTDIVQNEVTPHFVLYPVAGTRIMMWQELDGTRRNTPARFMIPVCLMGNHRTNIGTALGHFRWEISRTVAGSSWMDPVEGGLSGAYYDYLAFYKKNQNLTSVHKEALKNFIKKVRSDRERFAADYITWILFEYENKVKFNPVAREIFYRYVPFRQAIRQGLSQKPLFSDLEAKRENRIRKEVLRFETRKKRFEKAKVPLAPEIQQYMDFLQL